jgi:formylglycine-generating enzyme required for sulfatase activity
MVVLPAGSFLMGSPEGEAGRSDDEGPQRQVTVAAFAIGRYPVTFDEYDHCCAEMHWEKPDDRGWGRGKRPVITNIPK